MTLQTNKNTVRSLFSATDPGDTVAVLALLAPGMTAEVSGAPKVLTADEFEAMGRSFNVSFAKGIHHVLSMVAEGDWVVTRMEWTGRHVAEFNGIPASQAEVRVKAVSMDRLQDGRILERHAHFDVMALLVQIGVVPVAA